MCLMRPPKPPAPVAAPAPIPRAAPIEDMSPRVEIAESARMKTLSKTKTQAAGTKALQTGVSTPGSVSSSGLSIPQ